MINIWLKDETDDLVTYTYQYEQEPKGEIVYSKSHSGTKFLSGPGDDFLDSYSLHLRRKLFDMAKTGKFLKSAVIAWY